MRPSAPSRARPARTIRRRRRTRTCPEALETARVLIYGLGRSGLATATLLTSQHIPFAFYDDREVPHYRTLSDSLHWEEIPVHLGDLPQEAALGVDLVVVSPGVAPHSPTLLALESAGLRVVSEIELAFLFCRAPIIAVTGTNGKTTTSTLIDLLLCEAGLKSCLAGNIGYPFTQAVGERRTPDYYVVECSSFQLHHIERFDPSVAVYTGFAPNHLDWHGEVEAYLRAKLNLVRNMAGRDAIVYPAHSPELTRGLAGVAARRVTFGPRAQVGLDARRQVIRWRPPGKPARDFLDLSGVRRAVTYQIENVMECVLATAAVAVALGTGPRPLEAALRRFVPLPHRLEPVAVRDGVTYINDSKATSVDACIYALARQSSPVVLILGGRDKGLPFEGLATVARKRAKAVVVYGEAREKIARALEGNVPLRSVPTLTEAVVTARSIAAPGEVVLFSPACASFDFYASYEERGEAFRKAVQVL